MKTQFSLLIYTEIGTFELVRGSAEKCSKEFSEFAKKIKTATKWFQLSTLDNKLLLIDKQRIGGLSVQQFMVTPSNINENAPMYVEDFLNKVNNQYPQNEQTGNYPPGEVLDGGLR